MAASLSMYLYSLTRVVYESRDVFFGNYDSYVPLWTVYTVYVLSDQQTSCMMV